VHTRFILCPKLLVQSYHCAKTKSVLAICAFDHYIQSTQTSLTTRSTCSSLPIVYQYRIQRSEYLDAQYKILRHSHYDRLSFSCPYRVSSPPPTPCAQSLWCTPSYIDIYIARVDTSTSILEEYKGRSRGLVAARRHFICDAQLLSHQCTQSRRNTSCFMRSRCPDAACLNCTP
jgi:hypothetical protein